MANIKSAFKSIKQNEKRRLRNKAAITEIKSLIKKCHAAAKAKKTDDLKALCVQTYSKIDQAAKKKILHKNNADRKKSRLMLQVQKLSA